MKNNYVTNIGRGGLTFFVKKTSVLSYILIGRSAEIKLHVYVYMCRPNKQK